MKKLLILLLLSFTTIFTSIQANNNIIIFNEDFSSTFPTPDNVSNNLNVGINNGKLELETINDDWDSPSFLSSSISYNINENVTNDFIYEVDADITTYDTVGVLYVHSLVIEFENGNQYRSGISDFWGNSQEVVFQVFDITADNELYRSSKGTVINGNGTYTITIERNNGVIDFRLNGITYASVNNEASSNVSKVYLTNAKLPANNSQITKYDNLLFSYESAFSYPANINLDSNYGDYFDEPIQFQDQDELYIDYPISAQSANVNDDWQATAPTSGIGSFIFQHWYDLDNNVIFSTNASLSITGPNRDYNLRAIYSGVNEYNIALNMESGISGNIQYQGNSFNNNAITEVSNIIAQTVPDGTAWQANAPSVTGYNFDHWYNLNTNSIYSTNQSIIISDTTSNFNLEARYSPIPTYTFNATSELPEPPNFTYSVNGVGQTATYPVNVTVEEGDSVSITAQTDNIGFYTFDDWYDLDNNSVITTSPTYNQPNILRNYNVIARYSLPEEYQIDLNLTSNIGNIQFQIDGETAIIAPSISETVFAGTDWTANAPSAPTNYEFDGWFNVSDNSLFTTNTGFGITNTQDDYNLIAQFTELFTLTFDSAGGSAINDLIERDGDSIDLPEPTREGFIFTGWYETSDPFQVVVSEPYTVVGDISFTARWSPIIEVSFNSNGGTSVPSQFVTQSGIVIEPAIPSKFGYLFDGWYIDNNTFANEYDFTSPIPYTFDFSLHAKWVIGSDSDVDQTLSDWVSNSGLPTMVIVIVIMLAVTVTLGVINAQMFVIVITNVSLLFVFTSLGFIPLWILLVAGLAVLGFTIMMLFGGRTNA